MRVTHSSASFYCSPFLQVHYLKVSILIQAENFIFLKPRTYALIPTNVTPLFSKRMDGLSAIIFLERETDNLL